LAEFGYGLQQVLVESNGPIFWEPNGFEWRIGGQYSVNQSFTAVSINHSPAK